MTSLWRKNISRSPDQRAHHLRLRHEGQVHQAHPEEGQQVREQVRQAAGEGGQVCLRQPAEAVQGLSPGKNFILHNIINVRQVSRRRRRRPLGAGRPGCWSRSLPSDAQDLRTSINSSSSSSSSLIPSSLIFCLCIKTSILVHTYYIKLSLSCCIIVVTIVHIFIKKNQSVKSICDFFHLYLLKIYLGVNVFHQ